MKSNISPESIPQFYGIADVLHVVAGGALGWVDTDISGDIPAGSRAALIAGYYVVPGEWGVRGVGETTEPRGQYNMFPRIAPIADRASPHVELYRQANQNNYEVIGYWK